MMKLRPDIRTRMWAALAILALASLVVGVFAWNSLDRADTRLQEFHAQTLDDVTQSIRLSRQASDLAAVAPYLLSYETQFLIDREGVALQDALGQLLTDWPVVDDSQGVQADLRRAVTDMDSALATLIGSAGAAIDWVDERQRITARLRPLEAALYEASTQPNLTSTDRATWLTLLAMAGELSGAARAENMLGVGEHQRNFQVLQRALPPLSPESDIGIAHGELQDIRGTDTTLFEFRRQELNARLRSQSALFRISTSASTINQIATDFARAAEARLSVERARTTTSIAFAKAMIVVIGLISVSLALLTAIFVSNYVTGNIKAVADAMTQVVAGDHDVRLRRHVSADDEIGKLFHAFRVFRSNAARLDRSHALLNEKNELFERVFNNISDGVAILAADGRLTAFNAHVTSSLRLTTPPILGRDNIDALIAKSAFCDVMEPGASGYSTVTNADGLSLEVRVSVLPDGGKVWLFSDATERLQLQGRLQQIEHIETLGKMSGEVAHDFGNVLSSVATNLHLLETTSEDARRKAALSGLRNTVDMGTALVQRLLAFAKRQPLLPEVVDLTALVAGTEDLIAIGLGSDIELQLSLPDGPVWIRVDPGQMESALLNLCLNAGQAMDARGSIQVHVAAPSDGTVRLVVTDRGHGMSQDTLKRAVEPFFTTRTATGGTGLGLSMVYGFAKQSGGDIEIESKPGAGTTVSLVFPVEQARDTHPARARKTVLLVEDDPNDLETARLCLQQNGYAALSVQSFEAARQEIEAGTAYDLLLTDLHLPDGKLGSDLIKPFFDRNPTADAILASGRFDIEGVDQESGARCLPKPLSAAKVTAALTPGWRSPSRQDTP